MARLLHLISFLILFSPSLSFSENIGNHWQPIIDRLLDAGITKIGSFDVQAFRDAASKIGVQPLSEPPPSVLSGSRQSAYNRCGQQEVHIVDHLPTEAMASLGQLELHELLGVLCYNDNRANLSTALVTLSEMNESPAKQRLTERFAQTIFARPIRVAGGTGISGGGDLPTIFIKSEVLKFIMGDAQNRLNATDDFIVRYADIDFEPLQSRLPRFVYIQWSILRNHHESLSVYIPMERWKQGDGARQELIREAARKIMEVFPSYTHQSTRTFHPSDCDGRGPTVTYPMTQDPAVRQIQDARAGFLLKCRKFMNGETDFTVIAPALENQDEPKRSGNFYFSCVFQMGHGAPLENHPVVMAGRAQSSSVGYSSPAGGTIFADLMVNADGSIFGTRIMVHEPGQTLTSKDVSPISRATDATHSSTQIMIEGQSATFTCHRER